MPQERRDEAEPSGTPPSRTTAGPGSCTTLPIRRTGHACISSRLLLPSAKPCNWKRQREGLGDELGGGITTRKRKGQPPAGALGARREVEHGESDERR